MSRGARKAICGLLVLVSLLVVLAVNVLTVSAAAPSEDGGAGKQGFCDPHAQARDFGFAALPPVHELDESTSGRELGNPHVTVYGGGQEVRSVNRPGKFGYRFTETSSPNPVFVHWTVTGTLWAVGPHGGHAVEVGHTGMVVNSINLQREPSIGISPPARRGFYRFDLRIIDKRGKTIGSYSSYLRLVRQSARARLEVEHRVVPAGGRVRWRLGNLGSEEISSGGEPVMQRLEQRSWGRVHGVAEGLSLLMLFYLFPGGEGGCGSLHLPTDLIPGRYRLVEEVGLFRWPREKPIEVKLKAPFTVVGAG